MTATVTTEETTGAQPAELAFKAPDLEVGLANACAFAATDGARPVLNAVLFEADELDGEPAVRLVATDSYALLVETIPVDGVLDRPTLIERKALLEVVKLAKKCRGGHEGVRLVVAGPVATFTTRAGSVAAVVLDYDFPDYRVLLDGHKPGTPGTVSTGTWNLARLGKLRTTFGTPKLGPTVDVTFGETDRKPFAFEVRGSTCHGLVMPAPPRP